MTYPTWHVGDTCQRMNGRNKSLGTVESTEEMAGVHYVKVRWSDTKKTSVVRADRIARDDRPQKETTYYSLDQGLKQPWEEQAK